MFLRASVRLLQSCRAGLPAGAALPLLLAALSANAGAIAPSVHFDLAHFRLTLPVDADGGTTGMAATIPPSELAGRPGYASTHFYLADDGAMVFYAPSNGATSSPGQGSDHTRSELRELYSGDGTTEWTNRIGGTLTARCRVDQSSVDSDATIIGQIHGLSSIMAILDYNPVKQQIEARLYPSPSAKTPTLYVLRTAVAPGTIINYSLQWIGSSLSITINSHARNWTTASGWNGVPVYFKAGAYSAAPSAGNPAGDATKVAFYHLYIQH